MKPFESEGITTSKQPEICFFLDRTTDNPTVLNGLRGIGCKVVAHHELFVHDEADTVWIEYVAKKGWTIITNDKKIRSHPLEIKAVVVYEARMLCLSSGNMKSDTTLNLLISAMNLIEEFTLKNEPPYITRIRRGTGKKERISLNSLKLPPLSLYLP